MDRIKRWARTTWEYTKITLWCLLWITLIVVMAAIDKCRWSPM